MKQLPAPTASRHWSEQCDICGATMVAFDPFDLDAARRRHGWTPGRCTTHAQHVTTLTPDGPRTYPVARTTIEWSDAL